MKSKEVLSAMKNGNIPNEKVMEFSVGRDKEISEFQNILEYIEDGGASTKFINGEFGAGKSFFLKIIEELAYNRNFVVSRITLGNNLPFYKIDLVYNEVAKSLRCKTGTSLNHIIDRWITGLKVDVLDEVDDEDDYESQRELVEEYVLDGLLKTRDCSNSFATAVENYYRTREDGDDKIANYAQAWLRGDSGIPYPEKRKFGVKGGVNKQNVFHFFTALSTFIKSVGYSGLVVLVDEAEYTLNAPQKKSRDNAYNYMRDIYDNCSNGTFSNMLFVFAGTPQFFEDDNKGVHSYEALYNRIQDAIDSEYVDLRTPIITLKGFKKEDLEEISNTVINLHKETYNWDTSLVESVVNDLIENHIENGLTGESIVPRLYIRQLISILDTVEQNQKELNNTDKIKELFIEEKSINTEEDLYDDW